MKTPNSRVMTTDRLSGCVGASGYEVTLFRHEDNLHPENVTLFKGGFCDIRSSSLGMLAKQVVVQNSEIAAGIVRTKRPQGVKKAVSGLSHARKQRSQSMSGAIQHTLNIFQPKRLLAIGHSEGGITAIDGMTNALRNNDELPDDTNLGVLTIDTPGVHGTIDNPILAGLRKITTHCLPELQRMNWDERADLVADATKQLTPLELFYIAGEVRYLRSIDVTDEITSLRGMGVAVTHAHHNGDRLVPAGNKDCNFSTFFEGGHLGTIHGDGAKLMAGHIIDLSNILSADPTLCPNLSPAHEIKYA